MSDDKVLEFVDGNDDPVVASRVRESYFAFPPATEEQAARCRAAVVAAARSGRAGSRHWWWGGAVAAAVLAFVTLRPERLDDATRLAVDSAAASEVLPAGSTTIVNDGSAIRFEIRLPTNPARVSLVGDFNGWDAEATPMARTASNDVWIAQVPLSPGVHNYAFLIDGESWIVDPLAPQAPDDGLGPANAVVVVGSR